jgi:hypothetical protein
MIRLFKHYIPHAVLLLGLIDVLLLVAGSKPAGRCGCGRSSPKYVRSVTASRG